MQYEGVMGFFEEIELAPPDPIFGVMEAFKRDPRENKINLGVGVYKDATLKTPKMRAVEAAERLLLDREKDKVYLPIDGDALFCDHGGRLVFGDSLWKEKAGRFCSIQSVGGTGALRIGGELLKQGGFTAIALPDPTWANHKKIFAQSGLTLKSYPYYDREKKELSFDDFMSALEKMETKTAVLFHAVCHNPSGADLSLSQWEAVADLCLERGLFPFFDMAYLGFGEGLEEDAQGVRMFVEKGMEFFLELSFSKNLGLYGERVGALYYFSQKEHKAQRVKSQFKVVVRGTYSNPPIHGAAVVREILGDAGLRKVWEEELASMLLRITEMKHSLCGALNEDFYFLKDKKGMFAFIGVTPIQVERLQADHGIYMTRDGRINVAGLAPDNLDYVACAILKVIEK